MNGRSDDPLLPRNETVIRPVPGGAARAGAAVGTQVGGAGRGHAAPVSLDSVLPARAVETAPAGDFIAAGRNRLLAAAAPMLALGARLQSMVMQSDPEGLRRQAIDAVRTFESTATAAGVESRDVTIARYLLCTFFDSAVFRTPWGVQVNWARNSLLVTFHQEVVGGEKFFEILERLKADATRHIDLLELVYVCLALGFEGKHQGDTGRLQSMRSELQAIIASVRRGSDRPGGVPMLSAHWQGVRDTRSRLVRWLPWWTVALAGCVVLACTWIVLRNSLAAVSAPVKAALAVPAVQIDYGVPADLEAGQPGRLTSLLAAEESAGRVSVEEFGGRTIITLLDASAFASGSASPAPTLEPIVDRVAAALEQVPGAVMVVGHTDDQPVRSLRFASNFELSRARAGAVAERIRSGLSDPARVEWTGVGESEPRYRPPEDPANRPRNRRVEVIHRADASWGSSP